MTKSLFIGKVESAEMLGTMDEFRPGELWFAEVYELKVRVVDVLAGEDPGETAIVRVTAHARRFEGSTILILSDPDLELYVPRQSWWTSIRELACLPEDVVKDESFSRFVESSFEIGNEKCVSL